MNGRVCLGLVLSVGSGFLLLVGCDGKALQSQRLGSPSDSVKFEYATLEGPVVPDRVGYQLITPSGRNSGYLVKLIERLPSQPPRKNWKEYPENADLLNCLGAEGWEVTGQSLVKVTNHPTGGGEEEVDCFFWTLKRQVK